MPILYEDSSNSDTPSALIPAPFVNISKDYNKTSDGKKVGSTYTITLEGTILPDKGSPHSDATFYTSADGSPGPSSKYNSETTTVDQIQQSLFHKSQAIRKLFSTEGKKLSILTWQSGNPGFKCFPRINSVNIDDNRYSGPVTYSISLEADEIFMQDPSQASLSEEDWRKSAINIVAESGQSFSDNFHSGGTHTDPLKKIYITDASEGWDVSDNGVIKGVANTTTGIAEQTRTYSVSHSISANGKRAYGRLGLIREPWQNAKMWVEARMTPNPSQFPVDSTRVEDLFTSNKEGFNWDDAIFANGISPTEYVAYNYTRSNQIDKTSGSYSCTETWLMADFTNANQSVTEDINVDTSYDLSTNITSVTINGTITGLETMSSFSNTASTSKYTNAKARFDDLNASEGTSNNPIAKMAASLSGKTLKTVPLSRTVARNQVAGTVTFSYTFNDRTNNLNMSVVPISESLTVSVTYDTDKFATIEVPGRAAGPVIQSMNTVSLTSKSVSADVQFPADSTALEVAAGINKIIDRINELAPTAGTVYFKTADQESYDNYGKRYTRNVTWQY